MTEPGQDQYAITGHNEAGHTGFFLDGSIMIVQTGAGFERGGRNQFPTPL